MNTEPKLVVILGAGPAGLTAAYELAERKQPSLLLEKDSVVGGISRTVHFKDYHFDIGGHRFFTKVNRVNEFWHTLLGNEFLKRPRLSHIYYNKKFFLYPISPLDVMRKLGLWQTVLAGLSFLRAMIVKRKQEDSFEDYIINHFGERLYRTFFKSYTEKVWGIPCTEIKAEWAAQRIKGLSIPSVIKTAFFGNRGNTIKTLVEEFYYPRLGPGMMWERVRDRVTESGYAKILYKTKIEKIFHTGTRVTSVVLTSERGTPEKISCEALVSSIPLGEMIRLLDPPLSPKVIEATHKLHYRDFLIVALIIDRKDLFDDTWIYIHEPGVQVGRIQNFKNWSPDMVPDQSKTCLGLEYFCFTTDPIWNMTDQELINLGAEELEKIGLAKKEEVIDGTVVRMEKTYPVYDSAYEEAMPVIREALAPLKNLYPVGRNGMHKYNNQDHAMLTAMLSVENMFGAQHDIWDVNVERTYHEEKTE